jgi:acyl carrier protein
MEREKVRKMILDYLAEHVFSGSLPADFNDDTILVSNRLVNSIIVLHMVNYLEENLNIEFEAHEMNVDNIDSVNLMTDFVLNKINAGK